MKKMVLFTFLLFAFLLTETFSGFGAENTNRSLGLGCYIISGYNYRQLDYSENMNLPVKIDASGFALDMGMSIRATPIPFLFADFSVGILYFPSLRSAIATMNNFYSEFNFQDWDNSAWYIMSDLFIEVPYLPVNILAGYKHSFYENQLVAYIEGSQTIRLGFELLLTRIHYLRIIFEMPIVTHTQYDTGFRNGVITGLTGFNLQVAINFNTL